MAFVQQRHLPVSIAPVASVLSKVLTALHDTALDNGAKFSDIARDGLAASFWRGHGDQLGIHPGARIFPPRRTFRSRKAAVAGVSSKPHNHAMHNAFKENTIANSIPDLSFRIGDRAEMAAAKHKELRILRPHVGL